MPLKDEKAKMSRIGVKDGDTMHGFYKTLPPETTTQVAALLIRERVNIRHNWTRTIFSTK
jgi:hypothetical protein